MEKIAYTDGTKICILHTDGTVQQRESGFIEKYQDTARRIVKTNEWKQSGMGASMRGDYLLHSDEQNAPATLNGVAFTERENVLAYSFTVGQTSGIYYKDFSRETQDETHLIHSNEEEFCSLHCNKKDGTMLATVRKSGDVCFSPALFSKEGGYTRLTDGDTRDENPSFAQDGRVLFNSSAVGRNSQGAFVTYASSAIYSLDLLTLDMQNCKEAPTHSYIKPKEDAEGNLYAIKRPVKEQKSSNFLLDILLIPIRILEGIVGFIQFFVMAFSGKTLVSGKGAGSNPTKERKTAESEIFIDGNLVQVDKELKRNAKEGEYGFIPRSWQLVKLTKEGGEQVIKQGVADYALGKTAVYCTDGKHIFRIAEGKIKKIADTDFCLHIDVENTI